MLCSETQQRRRAPRGLAVAASVAVLPILASPTAHAATFPADNLWVPLTQDSISIGYTSGEPHR